MIKVYSNPSELILNIDKIGLHVVPVGGETTWKTKCAKYVHVLRMDNKR